MWWIKRIFTPESLAVQKTRDSVSAGSCFYKVKNAEASNNGFEAYAEKTYDVLVLDTNDKGIMTQSYYFYNGELKGLTPSFSAWDMVAYSIRKGTLTPQKTPEFLKDITIPQGMI